MDEWRKDGERAKKWLKRRGRWGPSMARLCGWLNREAKAPKKKGKRVCLMNLKPQIPKLFRGQK